MRRGGGRRLPVGGSMAPFAGRVVASCQPPSADRQLPSGIRSWREGGAVEAAQRTYELVAIGCSMGGMRALEVIFASLSKEFPLPIVVAQHRFRTSDRALPAYYCRHSRLEVVDADDKQWLHPGRIYLAPANYHLLIDKSNGHGELSLSVEAAVAHSRPSIDVLFESAADAFGAALVGVILTGANNDGARGVVKIKQRKGFTVVQDPATAEAPVMPQAAIATGRVDRILPLDRIGPFLVELCRNST